jgi:hypothetical protein
MASSDGALDPPWRPYPVSAIRIPKSFYYGFSGGWSVFIGGTLFSGGSVGFGGGVGFSTRQFCCASSLEE